jgi:hypothetical protein
MLDINTPKGQVFLQYERHLIDKIKSKYQVDIIETNKRREARIDNFLVRNFELIAVAEMKCRNMSQTQMKEWGDTWLVTQQKIIDGIEISKLLCVPFLGFLYLIPDDVILMWKITDSYGELLINFETKNTQTQATCNGNKVYRNNVYIPKKYAKVI